MTAAVSDDITISAAAAAVMAVITDIDAYPQWQEEIKAAEVIERDDRGRPARARFTVDAKMFTTTYTLAYAYSDGGVSWELVEGDQLRQLTGSYRLSAREDGRTDVRYELAVDPKVPLPGFLRRQAARRIADGALEGLRRRVEQTD